MEISSKPADDVRAQDVKAVGRAWSPVVAVAFAVFYLITSIYISSRRPLWFDEVLTVRLSGLPDAATIWKAMLHADPVMPFPYILLVHFFLKLSGVAEVAARLPSALAMAVGLLIVFDCTRRLTDGLHGLIAVSLLACSFLPYYGYEARSYGIYFMLAALSLWVWTHTAGTSRSSAVVFFALFAAGLMMHYYFVLCLVPYAVWELRMWRPWRPPSAKFVGGLLGVTCGAALLSREILAARQNSGDFWSPPSFTALRESFSNIFPGGLFLITLIMVWIALAAVKNSVASVPPIKEAERVGWFGFLIPVAGYVLAISVTNAFVPRYFIGMLPGVAVAFACLLWRFFRGTQHVAAGVFLLLIIPGIKGQLSTARHPQFIDPFGQQTQTRQIRALEKDVLRDGKHFILCTSSLLHMEAQYYTEHPEQYGLLVASDEARSKPTVRLTLSMAQFYPYRIWTLEDLKKHARESAVVEPGVDILKAMKEAGFQTTIRFAAPLEVAYFE